MEQVNRYFIGVIKNHYTDFNGRASRKQFWMFVLFYFILISLPLVALKTLFGDIILIVSSIISLVLFLPYISIATRRLHDVNKSGWWQLIAVIPMILAALFLGVPVLFFIMSAITLVLVILLIYFLVLSGDKDSNRFGDAPIQD